MKRKKMKVKSRKGVTLVELIVGITIIVIVFAGTLGAMVGGYTTTVNDANHNRAAVRNYSANEVIMTTIEKFKLKADTDIVGGTTGDDKEKKRNVILDAIKNEFSDLDASDIVGNVVTEGDSAINNFPSDNYEFQYIVICDKVPTIPSAAYSSEVRQISGASGNKAVPGITIKTALKSSSGILIYESFVPYSA